MTEPPKPPERKNPSDFWSGSLVAPSKSDTHVIKDAKMTTRTIIGVIAGCLWWTGAHAQATDQVTYYHTDAIGSVRIVTNATGAVVQRHDYLPFGEEYPTQPPDKRLFAGKEQDQETGFDYFGARYYAGQMGRFTTIDHGHVNGDIFDPQSWNAYAYARNNPLRVTDPDGSTYVICGYTDADRTTQSCGTVSDQYFAQLQGNPGKGIRLSGNEILMGDAVVGSYIQISVDPTSASVFGNAGLLADRWLKEQSAEMAKGALLTAATFGAGLAVRAGVEAIMAARLPVVVFKIGATNMAALSAAGIDAGTAKAAARLLIQSRLGTIPSVGTRIEGFVEINGRLLKVTAGVNAAGEVSVGAIRIIR